ncbi:MAG: alkaline phosphatase family protein [Acidobacteria bacterium]|nr:alkaline phosphatase family protein [Acidobacteriota bacterium]
MPSRRSILRTLALLAALLLLALPALAGPGPKGPKLVVVISVDQLSAERLAILGPRFKGGLARLIKEGVHFQKAYHAHASTETGPGHSVLLTGKHPGSTGIPENEWFDAAQGREVYCVEDSQSPVIGAPDANASPKNFRAHTLGEWLKADNPANRSYAVTGKDRSAILMAGHQADGVYWWHPKVGFTTSSFYAPVLPAWLQAHNGTIQARLRERTLVWEALDGRPRLIEVPGGVGKGIPFGLPKTIKASGVDVAKAALFNSSPFFDAAIVDAAEALIKAEQLGRGMGLDLLALGLSATDYVGHRYGTGGPEMEDHLLRLDALLGGFLPRLRAIDPNVIVVLTSDHACADFPERLQAEGKLSKDQAFRLDPRRTVFDPLNAHLRTAFNLAGDAVYKVSDPRNLSFNGEVLEAAKADRAAVVKAAQAWMRSQPFVRESVTTADLAALPMDSLKGRDPETLTLKERLRLSWTPGLGGDLISAFAPHILFIPLAFPATHGSPHDYDRHVPIIFWGAGKGPVSQPVSTVDLAPTLAALLRLKVPEAIDGVPRSLKAR